VTPPTPPREVADADAATEQYARRFEGPVGRWFLELQTRITFKALAGLAYGATILDVGGGHAQVAPPLSEAGFRVTVVGSSQGCGRLLQGWASSGRGPG